MITGGTGVNGLKKFNFDPKASDPCYCKNIDLLNMPNFLNLVIRLKYNSYIESFKFSQGLICIIGAGNHYKVQDSAMCGADMAQW